MKELNALLQQGSITPQIYAERLAANKIQKQRERGLAKQRKEREDSVRPVCQLMIFPHSIPLCPIV